MLTYFKLFLCAMFWGGTFVAGRELAHHMGPFSAAFLRFTVASLCMVAATRAHDGEFRAPTRAQWPAVVLLGMTGVFSYNVLFFYGLTTVPAARASVIVATNPVFIALGAALLFKEGLGPAKLAGILLSVCGAAYVISHGDMRELLHGSIGWGELAIFGCVASWVSYSLLGKHAMRDLTPHAAVAWSCIVGAAALSVPAAWGGLPGELAGYGWRAWVSVCYLGVFGTVLGFTWFYQGVKAIGASRAAVFINFVPVAATASAFFILGEPIDASLVLGGCMVLAGVWLTNRPAR